VDGEGCFFVNIYKRKDSVLGEGVKLVFKVTQDNRNSDLLASFVEIFGCGAIYSQSKSTGTVQDFMVTGLEGARSAPTFCPRGPPEGAPGEILI
jgi:hypothetical protein